MNLSQLNHLPQTNAVHASLQHGIKFKLCTESLLSVPRSAVVDGTISYGGSTGIGLTLPCKTYGEFFERNHFFTSVPVHAKKRLSDIQPAQHQDKLLSLCRNLHNENLATHYFSFTKVYNLFDNRPQDYFYNALSLNGLKSDGLYLNFSDSCACASHPVREKALHGSLMEFLERQSLLGSWLSKTCNYAINPEILKQITPYRSLTEKLLENGNLYIFENSKNMPGYTVMMFYFSQSEKDLVQYSVGSKSALSLADALCSALEELYQCYTFLYNMESTSSQLENKAGSGYHVAFQRCNTRQTREQIPFLHQNIPIKIKTVEDLQALKVYTDEEILSELAKISQDIYYYQQYDDALKLYYTKILSPDFFAHMSLAHPLNFECLYAKTLNISREQAYMEKIPFP